jgi:nitric oxide reductase NorE protein
MSTGPELDAEPADASYKPPNAPRHVPGEAGIWVLLFGDMVVFAALCATYLNARGSQRDLFARSQDALNRNLGAANTLILLTSSLLVVLATIAIRTEQWRHLTSRLTAAGFAVGCCFVAIKVFEYHEKIVAGLTPATNEFFMYYFVLTGFHLLHVIIGLGVLLLLMALARKPAHTCNQMNLFEGGACFWHMVDLLWLIIFPIIFLVR